MNTYELVELGFWASLWAVLRGRRIELFKPTEAA